MNLIGRHYAIRPYSEPFLRQHEENLRDAREFASAAVVYPDEGEELLAQASHRHQQLLDDAVAWLGIPVPPGTAIRYLPFAQFGKRWGQGAQAATTEEMPPQIWVSELSLGDPMLLQMVLVHELQHAADFSQGGLEMGICERELRARISVGLALEGVGADWYRDALRDATFWALLLFRTPAEAHLLEAYWEVLHEECREALRQGVLVPPSLLRCLSHELSREGVAIKGAWTYRFPEAPRSFEAIALPPTTPEPVSVEVVAATGVEAEDHAPAVNRVEEWRFYEAPFKLLEAEASKVGQLDSGVGVRPSYWREERPTGEELLAGLGAIVKGKEG